jgi:hypothetical protein
MKKMMLVGLVFFSDCGPSWSDCSTCQPGEESAESNNGEQIPIVVNVAVEQNQHQYQSNVNVNIAENTNVNTANYAENTTTADAGIPDTNVHDAGSQMTCRKVCVKYEEQKKCDQGWHNTDTKGRCSSSGNKCLEESVQCS